MKPTWPNTAASLFVCTSLVFSGGCATIFGGKTTLVRFESEPSGAAISIAGGGSCRATPCLIQVPSGTARVATASKKGHQPKSKLLSRKLRKVSWLNFLLFGYFWAGYLVDYLSASLFYLTPEQVKLVLPPDAAEAGEDGFAPGDGNNVKFQRLPYTPALERIKERFSDRELAVQVRRYRGHLVGQELWRAVDQVYLILMEMEAEGERLDLDEAFRRAAFMNAALPPKEDKE